MYALEGRVKVLCEEKREVESLDCSSTSTRSLAAIEPGQVLVLLVSVRTKRWAILLADDALQPDALGMKRTQVKKVSPSKK